MNEKHLFQLAMLCSLIGLTAVIIASQFIEAKTITIQEALQAKEGDYVKITGSVISIRQAEKAAFLDIKDETGEIKVVAFADNQGLVQKEPLPPFLDKGSNVSIEGKTSIYKGNIEIIAEKIEAISF